MEKSSWQTKIHYQLGELHPVYIILLRISILRVAQMSMVELSRNQHPGSARPVSISVYCWAVRELSRPEFESPLLPEIWEIKFIHLSTQSRYYKSVVQANEWFIIQPLASQTNIWIYFEEQKILISTKIEWSSYALINIVWSIFIKFYNKP